VIAVLKRASETAKKPTPKADEDATAPVAALAKQLGFAPVKLRQLNEGGALMHARGRSWGQLIFQDLFKKEQ
jgi:hypothetical protein